MANDRFEDDEHAENELLLYIDNDADLFRQQDLPIIKNLTAKKARGVYDHEKAVKLYMYLVENGAKKYAREFGGTWNMLFSRGTRLNVARRFVRQFESEYDAGVFKEYVPKKYQKVSGYKRRG